MAESVTIAVGFNDMTSMGNSIQQGACKTFGAKYFVPFLKFGKWDVSQFVKDQKVQPLQLFLQSLKTFFIAALQKLSY
jgi:hypothetical protein